MFELTPTNTAIYILVLLALFFVELFMFWGGCAIGMGERDTPSWPVSFIVVLPVFVVTVGLFEYVCRTYGVGVDSVSPTQAYGISTVPLALISGSLAGWIVAIALYIPMVTAGSFGKGFWVATTELLFRSVILLLIGGALSFLGATWQVSAKPKPKPEVTAPVKE